MTMTTKSGTDGLHGTASDYFTNQKALGQARSSCTTTLRYHSNNVSATIGGPIIPEHHQFFSSSAIEPLRASTSTGNSTADCYEDPQFADLGQAKFPRTRWAPRS